MAQRSATLLVVGNVVRHVRKAGSMPASEDPSKTVTWDYLEARVLTPQYDTLDVRFPTDGSIPVPSADEQVTLRCDVVATNGNLKLTVVEVVASVASLI